MLAFEGKDIVLSEGYFPQAMTDSGGPAFVTQSKTKHDLMSAALNVGFVLAQTKCEMELSTSFSSSKEKKEKSAYT